NIEEFALADGRKLYLLAEGRLVNLGASDGHPAEIMDMTFSLQALGLEYVKDRHAELGQQVVNVPLKIDEQIARIKLESLGIDIDALTAEQVAYLDSWQ